MPTSYQAPTAAQDEKDRTFSQSVDSNLKGVGSNMTVSTILADKDGTLHSAVRSDRVSDVVKRLHALRIGVLVVMESDRLVGIVSERDIVSRLGEVGASALDLTVGDLMTPDPVTCHPDDALLRTLRVMTEGKFRHLPVVRDGKLLDMISLGDVVKYRLRELEYEALRMKQMIVG